MKIVWTFIKNNWKFIVIVILLLLSLTMGVIIGKQAAESRQRRLDVKVAKAQLKEVLDSLESLNRELPLLRDSILVFRFLALEADSQAGEIRKERRKIYENTDKEVARVMELDRDSTAMLFARLSEEYLKGYRRQPKGSDSVR